MKLMMYMCLTKGENLKKFNLTMSKNEIMKNQMGYMVRAPEGMYSIWGLRYPPILNDVIGNII
jgi:hypothetical protein